MILRQFGIEILQNIDGSELKYTTNLSWKSEIYSQDTTSSWLKCPKKIDLEKTINSSKIKSLQENPAPYIINSLETNPKKLTFQKTSIFENIALLFQKLLTLN